MAKFVIAGRANCPYYAKAELLADYLQKNLPDFRIFKITKHPDDWEEWLEDVCEKNKWDHRTSPIIWRELLDRGGKGLLLGGYNEFLEHAQLYYGVTSSMTTELMMIIAEENLQAHIEKEEEKETLKDLVSPLQVWIASASANVCCHLIPLLVSGEVFGTNTEISLTLFDREHMEDSLRSLVMEAEDLVSPILRRVSFCTKSDEAFSQAQVIIILDDSTDEEVFTLESCLRSKMRLCRHYSYLMEKNADESVKVIIGGKTFVNLKAILLMQYAPNIAHNIIAVALGVEGQAKAAVARKMKTTPASIKDVIIWGNISGDNYVDLRKAKVYNYDSAIWGPPGYHHSVLNLIFDSEWVQKEFVMMLQTLSNTGKEYGGILGAHSIATTLKYWYHGSPPGEIVSLGIRSEEYLQRGRASRVTFYTVTGEISHVTLSECCTVEVAVLEHCHTGGFKLVGQFGIPEGIVFSMPVKFENGSWTVLTDLEDISLSEQKINRLAHDLFQEKLVALGDLASFQPMKEDLFSERKESLSLKVAVEEDKEQLMSDDSEGKFEGQWIQPGQR